MKYLDKILSLPCLAATTMAFSASTFPLNPPSSSSMVDKKRQQQQFVQSDTIDDENAQRAAAAAASSAAPWRVTLDIGREPLANMPFNWARSGCRMPLVIPCDFMSNNKVIPHSDTVSFTGPNGAVVSPVLGGDWTLSADNKEITLQLTFPQYMERRDVWIDAGTTFSLTSRIYSQAELEDLDQQFYDAREEAWEIGGELNQMVAKDVGLPPKVWNEEEQRWEKRKSSTTAPIWSQLQKRMQYIGAKAKQQQKADQRPRMKDLSQIGQLFLSTSNNSDNKEKERVYIQRQGVIKLGNVVAGRWSAEPLAQLIK